MVNEKDTEKKEKTSSHNKVESKKKEIEVHFCKDCKWYDKGSERKFHRKVGPKNEKGERTEIIEIRAICRNKKAKAYNRLVMAEYSRRQCPVWEKGVYSIPVEEQKKSELPKVDSTKTKADSNEDLVKT